MTASVKRKRHKRRARVAGAFGVFSAALGAVPAGHAEPLIGQGRNTFAMPGLIDMPSAEAQRDGDFGIALTRIGAGTQRNTLTFQIAPRITGAFRYSRVPGLMYDKDTREYTALYDRSFDLHWQVIEENGWIPAVAVGMRDFIGTGVYSSEYIVATKTFGKLRATGGIGWGRLGSSGSIGSSGHRPAYDFASNGGTFNDNSWFRGDFAPFAGVSYQVNDHLLLKAEYSSDAYVQETRLDDFDRKSRVNLGVSYQFNKNVAVELYSIGGTDVGFQFAMTINPKDPPFPSGIEKAPLPVRPRPSPAQDPEGWSGKWAQDPEVQPAIQKVLAESLKKDGQILESMSLTATRAELRVRNQTYGSEAQAVGHVARMATRALPPSVETIVVTPMADGMALSSLTFRRSDLERMENSGSYDMIDRVQITPAAQDPKQVRTSGFYPQYRWALTPYSAVSLFDPDEPFRIDVGAQYAARYEVTPGFVFSGVVQQKIAGNRGKSNRESNSKVQHVRSDLTEYNKRGDLTVQRLQGAWYTQPMTDVYARVTAGYLERMYGGVSTEVLWKPVDSRWGVGLEANWVKQRDFDQRFGFRDYDTVTGHASVYYDMGTGYTAEVDVGRYLAKDWGATVSIDRVFENGWKVGAFATITDMSADDYGEGSFDKGITLTIPISWSTGRPSISDIAATIRPLQRDGGARVDVDGRLYETVRGAHTGDLYDGWGRFWR
ncbi:YjbH domain-containing protein [Paenirhodobacter sp.]|uniref:YjbH domain-containing protein n=1 Tax=Paenirhodobacter sp. TaxID=1965326 RepID=UPI003B3C0DF7